jgi:hypothetical protein
MDKLPEASVKKQLFWTNGCFRKALLDHFGHRLTDKQKRYNLIELKRHIETKLNEKIRTPEINATYMKYVLQMPTKKLELIIRANKTGQQFRSGETIDRIMTELMERSMDPEPKETHES